MVTKRRPTIARGAVIERSLVMRWARRRRAFMLAQRPSTRRLGYSEALIDLTIWLKGQSKRTQRKGGIGR